MIKNGKLFKRIIYEILFVLDTVQKRKLVLVFAVILASSVLELIGVSAILPFVQAVISPNDLYSNPFISKLCTLLGISDSVSLIVLMGIMIIIIYLFKNAFLIFAKYVQIKYSANVQKSLAVTMLQTYMARPYTYFIDTNSSVIKSGCNGAINAFYAIIDALLGLATEILTMCLIGGYLLYCDWSTALGMIFIMSCVMIGTIVCFKPITKRAGKTNKIATVEKNKALSQAVEGIKDILVLKRNESFIDAFDEASEKVRKTTITYGLLNACPDRIAEGVCISGIIVVLCLRLMFGDGNMTIFIPKLAVFCMAAFRLLPSVGKITGRINTIVYNRPLQEMVYENFIEAQKFSREAGNSTISACENDNVNTELECYRKAQELGNTDFRIEFENVFFRYRNQVNPVLNNLNLMIAKGESIGLIGPSGAGKTTAADVLLGLLKPQSGRVTINGTDIYAIPYVWANMIGYVPQNVFLIDDTIRANVTFGVVNDDDEVVWDALERSQLKDYVKSLPDKLDTIVGERGVRLSGGQRQRIAIARALFLKPQILVMDEATAALDNDTERALMESIEALQGNITLVIVAHRLTTIRKCDKIFEIQNGKAIKRDVADFQRI